MKRLLFIIPIILIFSCKTYDVRFKSGNIKANGINIEYETFGSTSSKPILLIQGLGEQMIAWDEDIVIPLAKRGYYVIRFDNRDVGLSSKIEDKGITHPDEYAKAIMALTKGEKVKVSYTLDDMADDSVGLLDALGIKKAHICGLSMGGYIAQAIAIRHPSRVLSLISIMSGTGDPNQPKAKPEVVRVVFAPDPPDRKGTIKNRMKIRVMLAGSVLPFNEKRTLRMIEDSYDRSNYVIGILRQVLAIVAHGNRKPALKSVDVPTLVIHGSIDPLVPVEHGKDTANSIKGAKLLIIEGMGHTNPLPVEVLPKIFTAIDEITNQAAVFNHK